MYFEKIGEMLEDIENKEIEIAGGSVVGMVLAITNSLIKYIANLTIGKKKYADVQDKVIEISEKAEKLKNEAMETIDKDKEVLEKLLDGYKIRKENETEYIKVCKEAVEFCLKVLKNAQETYQLSEEISKVGNKMLSSDFKICKYYAYASIQSAKVNVMINLEQIKDEKYKKDVMEEIGTVPFSKN